jgi:hypothetical protein
MYRRETMTFLVDYNLDGYALVFLFYLMDCLSSANRVINNILHCLSFGSQLGWFIERERSQYISFLPRTATSIIPRK